jgi:hypothetical protein
MLAALMEAPGLYTRKHMVGTCTPADYKQPPFLLIWMLTHTRCPCVWVPSVLPMDLSQSDISQGHRYCRKST